VAPIGEAGELYARGAAVVEQRLDGGADRAARKEDVVDEHASHPLERKVQLGVPHDRLWVDRSLSPAHAYVVAVERDVDGAELDLVARQLGDQMPEPLGERHAARVDADERDALQIGVPLDDLVRDAREAALDRLAVEQDLLGGDARLAQ
jgi:hypothetical protein